jgi:hypothetical protein
MRKSTEKLERNRLASTQFHQNVKRRLNKPCKRSPFSGVPAVVTRRMDALISLNVAP